MIEDLPWSRHLALRYRVIPQNKMTPNSGVDLSFRGQPGSEAVPKASPPNPPEEDEPWSAESVQRWLRKTEDHLSALAFKLRGSGHSENALRDCIYDVRAAQKDASGLLEDLHSQVKDYEDLIEAVRSFEEDCLQGHLELADHVEERLDSRRAEREAQQAQRAQASAEPVPQPNSESDLSGLSPEEQAQLKKLLAKMGQGQASATSSASSSGQQAETAENWLRHQ